MNKYTFSRKFITKSADFIIEAIKVKLKEDGFFLGVGQGKKYMVNRFSSTSIYYTGIARNQSKQEDFDIEELKTAIEIMKRLPDFTTNTDLLKEKISTAMYRKRTPLFGVLTHTGVIVEVEEKPEEKPEE